MTFTITPPEELKLPKPAKGTKVEYYDPSQPLGFRCAWSIEWIVFKDETHTTHIHPRQWKFNGGAPDLEKLPDEYLLAELEDVACRGGAPFAGMAAKLHFEYDELQDAGQVENWRYFVIDLLQKIHTGVPQRLSPYNPPAETSLMRTMKAR
jgi:hypothetical protein